MNSIVPDGGEPLAIAIDRSAATSLTDQIHAGIEQAIRGGLLRPGARLPSWQSLATQLGVARGTVQRAYLSLASAQWVTSSPATGTWVAERPTASLPTFARELPLPDGYSYYGEPAPFRMGVPARDLFPAKAFAKLHVRCARAEAATPDCYPDPRGEAGLRHEIATHLALARGIACTPAQIFVSGGFLAGLGTVLRILGLQGSAIWTEDPCFPVVRQALRVSGAYPCAIPVDAAGIDVEEGRRRAPGARAALVTPGQQAPLGMALSIARRQALLAWANEQDAWIIEDDYLGELQLRGRAAPALASTDPGGRVIHIGSFSKTISPMLRIGFIVVPASLVPRFTDAVAYTGGAPGTAIQNAVSTFMREGHYLRHLRRVKRSLSATALTLRSGLAGHGLDVEIAGLAAIIELAPDTSDCAIAEAAVAMGLAPAPLSPWYAEPHGARSGLMLGIASARGSALARNIERLAAIIRDDAGG